MLRGIHFVVIRRELQGSLSLPLVIWRVIAHGIYISLKPAALRGSGRL